jgi:phosphoribosylglycinamide formyltransferase 1
MDRIKLAVLISGAGRTLKNFIDLAAEGSLPVDIRLILSSNSRAGGLKLARDAGIATQVLRRNDYDTDSDYGRAVFDACRAAEVDYVVMAGFLKLVPVPADFEHRVLNIHPALIPAFCGPSMYGHHVHEEVLEHGAKVTGCTVHFVDNE